tara:strand:+ start:1127 stop:1354 length:228 start_codon:yes stop_codon:yes gene_type:complete
MSIKTKRKVCVEVISFDNTSYVMRIPFYDYDVADWYELSNGWDRVHDDVGSWILITDVLHQAELEAHWIDEKDGY